MTKVSRRRDTRREDPPGGAKARNTDPRYAKLTIGVCPDQWGVWFPEDEKQIDWDVALDEMADAGFSVMETGPFGYFPTDPVRLKEEMDARGFHVVAGTGWGILHKAEAWADTEKLFRSIGETHAAVGAEYVVHLPPMFRDEKTGAYTDDRVLSTEAWNLYIKQRRPAGPDHEGGLRPEDGAAPPRRQPHRDARGHRPHLPGDRPRVRRLLPRHRAHRLRRRRPDGAVPQVPRAHLLRAHQGDGPGAGQAGPRRGLAVRQGRARRLLGDAARRPARHARPHRGARRPRQGALRGLRAGHVRLRQGRPAARSPSRPASTSPRSVSAPPERH